MIVDNRKKLTPIQKKVEKMWVVRRRVEVEIKEMLYGCIKKMEDVTGLKVKQINIEIRRPFPVPHKTQKTDISVDVLI